MVEIKITSETDSGDKNNVLFTDPGRVVSTFSYWLLDALTGF